MRPIFFPWKPKFFFDRTFGERPNPSLFPKKVGQSLGLPQPPLPSVRPSDGFCILNPVVGFRFFLAHQGFA